MARKNQLRTQRAGTVINATAKQQESDIIKALHKVIGELELKFGTRVHFIHEKQLYLHKIVAELKDLYPEAEFHCHFENTFIKPDGGILYIRGTGEENIGYPILISEVKNQGTNDRRIREGKPKQSRGNAIERLGKNLIGLRTALMGESIFPFICFGYGCDFDNDSSILDRVSTMALFGKLNKTYLYNEVCGKLNRGSFYFRLEPWTVKEMAKIMQDIAERSLFYYFSKYGEDHFKIDRP